MESTHAAVTAPFQRDPLRGYRRRDVTAAALPHRAGELLRQRPDIPPEDVDDRTGYTVATEWIGRATAVVAVVLFVLVMIAIQKGLDVRDSSDEIVTNFHTANNYFDQRTDLDAPARARSQLEQLREVLADLNRTAEADVNELAGLLPDMRALLAAGQGDTRIAKELDGIATVLKESAGSLRRIAGDADTTVSTVDRRIDQALVLVQELNNELAKSTRKLAPIPAQDGLIPPPGGN